MYRIIDESFMVALNIRKKFMAKTRVKNCG